MGLISRVSSRTYRNRMKFLAGSLFLIGSVFGKLKDGDCEVCISVVNKFIKAADDAGASGMEEIKKVVRSTCSDLKQRENRFCYYIGATDDAATTMINEVTKPMSFHMPAEKICEKLKPKDGQICELKYEKQLDWKNINLSKMKVKELKKILAGWNDQCKGCLEKSDFIKRIEELKPKFVKEEL